MESLSLCFCGVSGSVHGMIDDMCRRCGVASRPCGEGGCLVLNFASCRMGSECRLASLRYSNLTAHPGSGRLDGLARARIIRRLSLEVRQDFPGPGGSPKRPFKMLFQDEGATDFQTPISVPSERTSLRKASINLRLTGPGVPSPISRSSSFTIGMVSAAVPVRKDSSAV